MTRFAGMSEEAVEHDRRLADEGNALRQHIYELKRREADLLSQLRQTMEDTAGARLKLERVNSEIARLGGA